MVWYSKVEVLNEMDYDDSMRILLLLIYFCLIFTVQAKDVYRTVDEHGNVVFSDTPVEGAEKIKVYDVQTVNPGVVPKFVYTPAAEADTYTRLEILSPENEAVVQSDNGIVTVSVALEPALNVRAGHYLVLRLDGNEAASGAGTQFTLNNLERGTHTLDIAVVNNSGNQFINSPATSFTIYQHSALHKDSTVGKLPKPTPPPPPAPAP